MEFYFRKDGQNLGPISIFRVRELLEDGALTPQHHGWHEGMDEWKPLLEIPALEAVLPKELAPKASAATDDEDFLPDEYYHPGPAQTLDDAVPPPLPFPNEVPDHPHTELTLAQAQMIVRARQGLAWRRFFARTADILLAGMVLTPLAAWLGWIEMGEVFVPRLLVVLFISFLWIPVEALCVHVWGCTPGKWLLGLNVATKDGERLTWKQAFARAVDVWFVGCGMDLPILMVLLKFLAMVRLRQMGETSWDAALGLKVVAKPLVPGGVVGLVMIFLATMVLRMIIFHHYPLPSHLGEEERQLLEQIKQMPTLPATTQGVSTVMAVQGPSLCSNSADQNHDEGSVNERPCASVMTSRNV